jgi:hypothetical protein
MPVPLFPFQGLSIVIVILGEPSLELIYPEQSPINTLAWARLGP